MVGAKMTANELADELENTYPFVGVMEIAATMLRQQQEEIKDLKQQVAFLEDWRAIWAPTIKQIMGIDGKCGEE